MQTRHVCVPIGSPAWHYYSAAGWVVVRAEGNWVHLLQPSPAEMQLH